MQHTKRSASLGSWCLQLVYNPRDGRNRGHEAGASEPTEPELTEPERAQKPSFPLRSHPLALVLPAYLALLLAMGASCCALAHLLSSDVWPSALLGALLVSGGLAVGAGCGAPWLNRTCALLRWPWIVLLGALTVWARFAWMLPGEESNALMALGLGWLCISSVALVGLNPAKRNLPLNAPLVPALALLSLVCLLSVDTQVQVCFMGFVGASLYLLCYDRFLQLPASEMAVGAATAAPAILSSRAAFRVAAGRAGWRWWRLSGLVSGLWFVLLMASGALFYLPLETYLPHVSALEHNRNRAALVDANPDYTTSDAYIELHGGDYPLSEEPVLHITAEQGETSGLWRGRTYERYVRSRWEDEQGSDSLIPVRRNRGGRRIRLRWNFNPSLPTLPARLGQRNAVVEQIEELTDRSTAIYASGEPLKAESRRFPIPQRDDVFAALRGDEDEGRQWHRGYQVQSSVVRPRRDVLLTLPGYETSKSALSEPIRLNLQLPEDAATREKLQLISRQILAAAPDKPRTPFAKVRAVSDYLSRNCLYSLSSPVVPPTEDAVTFFLTQSREGACDMFASSMALLLRSMDVPTRVATGYLRTDEAGEKSPSSPAATPTSWLVRGRDAHAWIEFYVPQIGWIPFDPTAETRSLEDTAAPDAQLSLPRLSGSITSLLLPAAGLFLLFLSVVWPQIEARRARPRLDEAAQRRRDIARCYERAQKDVQRRVPRALHLTPHEYENQVSVAPLPLAAKQEFAALTFLYIAARYGEVPEVAAAEVEGCLKRLRRAIKSRK